MGPRFLGRGNDKYHNFEGVATASFNGAALFRARKYFANIRPRKIENSFNGAALFRARKFKQMSVVLGAYYASMGPRFLGRGNSWTMLHAFATINASMGPRFLGRGNKSNIQHHSDPRLASMGPRFLGRGNANRIILPIWDDTKLQWGRAF